MCVPVDKLSADSILEQEIQEKFLGLGGRLGRGSVGDIVDRDGVDPVSVEAAHGGGREDVKVETRFGLP